MLEIKARAKINWTLDVVGKRPDGYHDLDMLMQSVSIFDTLTLDHADDLSLTVGRGRVPADQNNLVLRAANALKAATGIAKGAVITLEKRIPVSAGMGGGSADAAGALFGLNRLWQTGLSDAQLEEIGLTVGADVPFCVRGGLQRAQGVGDILTPVPMRRSLWLVVIQPCRGLSTKDVFGKVSATSGEKTVQVDNEIAMCALSQGDVNLLARNLGNALEPIASVLRPQIAGAIASLKENGAIAAQMTGSGSAVFGLFPTAKSARQAHKVLRMLFKVCRMACTESAGISIEEKK